MMSEHESTLDRFRSLAIPRADSAPGVLELTSLQLPDVDHHRLAKDSEGRALLLISVKEGLGEFPSPVRLEYLAIDHGVKCRVHHRELGSSEGLFSVVSCLSLERALQEHFILVGVSLLRGFDPQPSAAKVAAELGAVIALFRALSSPAKRSVQGLWAELFLISRLSDCERAVCAWHADAREKFDFAEGRERVEVKSTASGGREHHFSLEQLLPPANSVVRVASIRTERSGGGLSLGDLIDRIRVKLQRRPSVLTQFELVVADTLGGSLFVALRDAFDAELAEQSLRFYDVGSIPKPNSPLPRGVSAVRFVADLSDTTPLELEAVPASRGGLLELFATAC